MPGQGASCCQGCGVVAPTHYVTFRQNIGALILRFRRSIKGHLCRNCINQHFASMTLITGLVGWFGVISFVLTPFILIGNLFGYLSSLSVKPNPGSQATGTGLAWFAVFMAALPFLAILLFFALAVFGVAHHPSGYER
jgi:hypothetical protein